MRGAPREIDEPDCETDDPDRCMAEPIRADPGPARTPIPARADPDPICRTPDPLCRTPDPICRTDPPALLFAPRPDPTRRIPTTDPLRRPPLEMRADIDGFDNDERERSVAAGVAYLAFPRMAELRGDCDMAILDMDRAAAELRCEPPDPDPDPDPDPEPEPELVHDPDPDPDPELRPVDADVVQDPDLRADGWPCICIPFFHMTAKKITTHARSPRTRWKMQSECVRWKIPNESPSRRPSCLSGDA